MTEPVQSTSRDIGTVVDAMATDTFRAVGLAFEHKAKAMDLVADIQPLADEEMQQMIMLGPFACALPSFGKLVMNGGRRVLAAYHNRAAQNLLPQ